MFKRSWQGVVALVPSIGGPRVRSYREHGKCKQSGCRFIPYDLAMWLMLLPERDGDRPGIGFTSRLYGTENSLLPELKADGEYIKKVTRRNGVTYVTVEFS